MSAERNKRFDELLGVIPQLLENFDDPRVEEARQLIIEETEEYTSKDVYIAAGNDTYFARFMNAVFSHVDHDPDQMHNFVSFFYTGKLFMTIRKVFLPK